MKNNKKTFDRLKKSRIWPSFVIFILSVIAGLFLLAMEFEIYAAYAVETKFDHTFVHAQGTVNSMDYHMQSEEDAAGALKEAAELYSEATIAVRDQDGQLDADFFRGEVFDARGETVVAEAISLAKKLNMRAVAEGVEKKEQVDFLAAQGCDMIQGYYYAKPMPAYEYAVGLDRQVTL